MTNTKSNFITYLYDETHSTNIDDALKKAKNRKKLAKKMHAAEKGEGKWFLLENT